MVNFDKHMQEIEKYITEKIPDIKPSVQLEIMAYLGYKLVVINNEILQERDKEWKRSFNRECIPRRTKKEDTNE